MNSLTSCILSLSVRSWSFIIALSSLTQPEKNNCAEGEVPPFSFYNLGGFSFLNSLAKMFKVDCSVFRPDF